MTKERNYLRLGTIAGDIDEGPVLYKPSPDRPLHLPSLIRTVLLVLESEGRATPPVRQETAREADARRDAIVLGILEFIIQEDGRPNSRICPFSELTPYLDCYDLDEWCVRLRLAMDCMRRGYSIRELRTAVRLRWPGRPDTVAETQTESAVESGKGTEVGVRGKPRRSQLPA
jgi:hypothetical protein